MEKCSRAGSLREPRFRPAWQYNLSRADIQQLLPVKVAKAVTLCRGYLRLTIAVQWVKSLRVLYVNPAFLQACFEGLPPVLFIVLG